MTQASLKNAQRLAFLGFFVAVSMILSYLETLIPVYFGAPGIKPGLANLFVLLLLMEKRHGEAVAVNLIRIVLGGFLFGNLFSIVYSLAGAALSMAVMCGMLRFGHFHPLSTSVAGGIAHNLAQLIVALLILDTGSLLYYLPVLVFFGGAAGVLNGVLAGVLKPYLHRLWRDS
ncbi:MAG: Gx transporter family protein [Clostridium sp.]|nr:Gx transporter family protein [Clostridium sp.]